MSFQKGWFEVAEPMGMGLEDLFRPHVFVKEGDAGRANRNFGIYPPIEEFKRQRLKIERLEGQRPLRALGFACPNSSSVSPHWCCSLS